MAAPVYGGYRAPRTLDDIRLIPGERGLLLGMTRSGKTTLAEWLLHDQIDRYDNTRLLICDSKPHFRGDKELSGIPAWWRYRKWDSGYGSYWPGSVVLPPSENAERDISWAWRQGYRVVIAQTSPNRQEIPWLAECIEAAYSLKRRNEKLTIYTDETNHFFRWKRSNGAAIVNTLTSGGERSVGALLGGQRPANISVEAIESATNLYWFYTPFWEDVKKLRAMDVPMDAQPPALGTHGFYVFSRLHPVRGVCKLPQAAIDALHARP